MEVRKEIIRPGTYTYLNQSGLPERLTVTPDTIKHFHDNGNAMIADSLSIPIPFEHQPDAKVQTASERAAHQLVNNAGFVKSYEVDKDNRLFGILDIPDAGIVSKLPTTIRSVSPWINSFTDGNGKKWDGVISHVALTTRPRIANQAPFESTGAAMSMLGSMTDKVFDPKKTKDVFLSRFGLLKKEGKTFKPAFPIGFSLMTGVLLSKDEPFPEDDDDEIDDDETDADIIEDGEETDTNTEGEVDPAATELAKDDSMTGMDDANDLSFEELIPHLLEMHGIHVPAGGKGKEFLQALVVGLLSSAKALSAADGGADDTVLGDNPADPANPNAPKKPGPVVQESPPMYMSLTAQQVQAIKDPAQKQIAEAFLSMRQENERNKSIAQAATKNILDDAARQRQARLDRLLTRIPANSRDKLIQMFSQPSAALSLSNDGLVKDPMAVMLETFESMIPDLPAMLKNGVRLSEMQQPADGGILTDSQAEALANQQLRRHGMNPAASTGAA